MDKLIEKISSYNVLNNILPGAVFCFLLKVFLKIDILNDGIIEKLFIYYFVGMITSRIGSIIVEPVLIKIKFVIFSPYKDFIIASAKDEKVNVLLETNNTYRTMLSMCLLFLITKIYILFEKNFNWLTKYTGVIVVVFLLIIFTFSYKKQTDYISKRVKIVNTKSKEENKYEYSKNIVSR